MKRILLAAGAIAIVSICAAQTYGGGSSSGSTQSGTYSGAAEYNIPWDAATTQEINGEFMWFDTLTPQEGGVGEQRAWVRTDYGPVCVSLGPDYFVKSTDIKIMPHQKVWVYGSMVKKSDGSEVLLARQIRTSTRTWNVRGETGMPFWTANGDIYRSSSGSYSSGGNYGWSGSSYNTNNVQTFRGEVKRIELVPAMEGAPAGAHIVINTSDNKEVAVHVGPEWAMYNRGNTIAVGDTIEVRGSVYDHMGTQMVYPATIMVHGNTLTFRDDSGRWSSSYMGTSGETTSSGNTVYIDDSWAANSAYNRMFKTDTIDTWNGEVVSVDSYRLPGSTYPGTVAMVKVGADTYPVQLGPSWFIDKQQYQLKPGDTIMFTGSKTMFDDQSVIYATEIHRGSTVWVFRDRNGRPVWIVRR